MMNGINFSICSTQKNVSLFSRNRSYSRTDDRRAMSKRQVPGKEETSRGVAKSRLERSSTALSLTSRASDSSSSATLSTGRPAGISSEYLKDPTLDRSPSNKNDKLKIKTIQNVCSKFCAQEYSLAHLRIPACGNSALKQGRGSVPTRISKRGR